MRLFTLLMAMVLFIGNHAIAQSDCEVDMESISGNYDGDCKRGKAHGEGKAVGTDTYEGEFKKGLPEGFGKYTWADGHYYEGEWNEGMKEGEGKMVFIKTSGKDSVVTGFWEKDEYFGKYKEPYKILSKSTEIQRVVVRKIASTPNQITVNFNRGTQRLILEGGGPANQTGNGWINIDFPFKGRIETQVGTTQGTGVGTRTVFLDFEIYEAGQWQIQILINQDI